MTEAQREKRRARERRYNSSPKGRERHRRYNVSEKGSERQAKYEASRIRVWCGEFSTTYRVDPDRKDEVVAWIAEKVGAFREGQQEEYAEWNDTLLAQSEELEQAVKDGGDLPSWALDMLGGDLTGSKLVAV